MNHIFIDTFCGYLETERTQGDALQKKLKALFKVVHTIKGRYNKYGSRKYGNGSGEFGISRCEFEKFGVTEIQLRQLLDILRKNGFIIKVREDRYINKETGRPNCRNIYILGNKLIKYLRQVKELFENVENIKPIAYLNEKIVDFNKYADGYSIIRSLFDYQAKEKTERYKVKKFGDGQKFNSSINVFSYFKQNKHYNLFNFIKTKLSLSAYETFKFLQVKGYII